MSLFDCREQNYPRVLIFLTPLTSNFGGLKDLGNKHFDNLCSTKIHNQTNFYDYVLDWTRLVLKHQIWDGITGTPKKKKEKLKSK